MSQTNLFEYSYHCIWWSIFIPATYTYYIFHHHEVPCRLKRLIIPHHSSCSLALSIFSCHETRLPIIWLSFLSFYQLILLVIALHNHFYLLMMWQKHCTHLLLMFVPCIFMIQNIQITQFCCAWYFLYYIKSYLCCFKWLSCLFIFVQN